MQGLQIGGRYADPTVRGRSFGLVIPTSLAGNFASNWPFEENKLYLKERLYQKSCIFEFGKFYCYKRAFKTV